MFDNQKVQRSFSDDFAQLVKAPETSGCHSAVRVWQWTIKFTSQPSHFPYSTPSHFCHMTAGSDLLSEMSLKRNCHNGTMWIGFNYTEMFAKPFLMNTRLNCPIKRVQNAEI